MSALPPLGRSGGSPLRVEISSVEIHPPGRMGSRSSRGSTAWRQSSQPAVAAAAVRQPAEESSLLAESGEGSRAVAAVRSAGSPPVVAPAGAITLHRGEAPTELLPGLETSLIVEHRSAVVSSAAFGAVHPVAAALYRGAAQRGYLASRMTLGSRLSAVA